MRHVVVAALATLVPALAACGGTSTGPATPNPSSRSLIGTDPWTLTMDDGACRLTGTGDTARDGQCTDLGGALALAPDVGANLGAAVGRVAIEREATAGGARGVLSTTGAEYVIRYDDWAAIERGLRAHIIAQRLAEREARYAALPPCATPGEVVVDYVACPGVGGVSDGCRAPEVVCGAPLADGAPCRLDRACASGACDVHGVCTPD